jgi:uncharacterized membrane protein YhhN
MSPVAPRNVLVAYAVVGVVNIVCVASSLSLPATAAKALLVPLLLVWLLLTVRGGCSPRGSVRWFAVGLLFAWFGDLLLTQDADAYFAAGLASFLVMQICYIVAFVRVPGPGLVRAWKVTVVPFVIVYVCINLLISPGVGDLRIPVLVYSAALVVMSLVALDLVLRVPRPLGWRIAGGAVLFLVSDALIALTAFGPLTESAIWSAVIMATYITAQAMIVTGFGTAVAQGERASIRR